MGDLTIRGIAKPVTFNVEHFGIIKDPSGGERAGFEISGSLSRAEFGLKWNTLTEAGGAVVADKRNILANIELLNQI